MPDTTVFTARKIVTLNPSTPEATAVAVREGRILAVGTLEECASWGPHTVDRRFEGEVLVPGFVEAHGHTADGMVSMLPYVGFHDFPLADGGVARGVHGYDELIEVLKKADAALPEGEPLVANSFDPIFFPGEARLSKEHLDRVSTKRQVVVRHASGHLLTLNSVALREEKIGRDCATPGVPRGADGEPTGELQEGPAMSLAVRSQKKLMALNMNPELVRNHGRLCRNAGVTTSTELLGFLLVAPKLVDAWHGVVDADDFPARLVLYNAPTIPGRTVDYEAVAEQALALRERDTPKMRNMGAKLLTDGSIQGWTAVMLWPGYYTGEDQGLLVVTPEELTAQLRAFHRRRMNVHCHCNGNGGAQAFIDAVERVLAEDAWLDHRHVVQHSQTTTQAQYRRMARLGLCANIFTNHAWYWGDQHWNLTMGPERTRAMWACRTALREGVALSTHSDSGVTPIGQLMTMWCAVNRLSHTGRRLGEEERITAAEALHATTLGAAFQLHLDHEIGSIECGKLADFTVLENSPLDVDPLAIKDIRVWGTVIGGVPYEAERAR
ncbi:MAG: amidohydrolase [Alphaproteobacteria bacterium]